MSSELGISLNYLQSSCLPKDSLHLMPNFVTLIFFGGGVEYSFSFEVVFLWIAKLKYSNIFSPSQN